MLTTRSTLIVGICALAIALSGCSTSNTTVPPGSEVQDRAPVTQAYVGAQIVHADLTERIATIRNGQSLGTGFLICKSADGRQTAILKGLPSSGSLATADILEGAPGINDRVTPASAAESARLAKIYRDAGADNQ